MVGGQLEVGFGHSRGRRWWGIAPNAHFTRLFRVALQLWASWGWCRNSGRFSTGTREVVSEGRSCVDPLNILVCASLSLEHRSGTRSTFGVSREVAFENVPMWCGSAGDPCCAVFRMSIGHFIDNSKLATAGLWSDGDRHLVERSASRVISRWARPEPYREPTSTKLAHGSYSNGGRQFEPRAATNVA